MEQQASRLSRKTLLGYSTGAMGQVGIFAVLVFYLPNFYIDVIKMPAVWLGIAMMVPRLLNAVVDPLVGYVSDNARWKRGRRRPFFLLGSIPAGIFFFVIFTPPQLSALQTTIFLGIILAVFYISFSIFETPHAALAPELTTDYGERLRLSGYRQFMGSCGELIGIMLLLGLLETFVSTPKPVLQFYDEVQRQRAIREEMAQTQPALRDDYSQEVALVVKEIGQIDLIPALAAHLEQYYGKTQARPLLTPLQGKTPQEIFSLSGIGDPDDLFAVYQNLSALQDDVRHAQSPAQIKAATDTFIENLEIFLLREKRFSYTLMAVMMGLLLIVSGLISYWGTSETSTQQLKSNYSFAEGLRCAVRNYPFVILVVCCTLTVMADRIVVGQLMFIFKCWFHLEAKEMELVMLIYYIGYLSSIPFWLWCGQRWEKKGAYFLAIFGYMTMVILISTLAGDKTTLCVFGLGAGFCNTGMYMMPLALIPDIVEWDQLQTGERREGSYMGIWSFSMKTGLGIAILLLGFLLSMVGYQPNQEQTAATLRHWKFAFVLVPTVLLSLCAVCCTFFPITKEKHAEMLRILQARQAASNGQEETDSKSS